MLAVSTAEVTGRKKGHDVRCIESTPVSVCRLACACGRYAENLIGRLNHTVYHCDRRREFAHVVIMTKTTESVRD